SHGSEDVDTGADGSDRPRADAPRRNDPGYGQALRSRARGSQPRSRPSRPTELTQHHLTHRGSAPGPTLGQFLHTPRASLVTQSPSHGGLRRGDALARFSGTPEAHRNTGSLEGRSMEAPESLDQLRALGRMIWLGPARGWVAEPEEVMGALSHDGFQEVKNETAPPPRRPPTGGAWHRL